MLSDLRRRLHARFVVWALRVRPPEPVPIVLTQRRVYVLPTRAGLLYGISLLVMLAGAINYNLSLGYALVFLLAGQGVVATLHGFRNLAGVSLTVGAAEPVFAGATARFPLHLANPDPRERRCVRIALPGQAAVDIDLPARDGACVLLPQATLRRGRLAMPRVTLESTWPLGLVRCWAYAAPALECIVYPRPADAVPPAPTFSGHAGGRLTRAGGDDDFAGLRRHRPGDPPQHVAWKTAARLDGAAPLQTKQFAGTAAPTPWFDWDQLAPAMATEARLAVLARWVVDAEAAGQAWGLRLPGQSIAPAAGPAHAHACLQALALHDLPEHAV